MKYEFIHANRSDYAVEEMCHVLNTSRSGYYIWLKQGEPKRIRRDKELLVKIKRSFEKNKERYGAPRIYKDLRAEKISCSKPRIARLMKENNLKAKAARKYKVTTDSSHSKPVAPNLLKQNFNVAAQNQVWVSDITYIWTMKGWLYLAIVLDLYSRKIVGWSMSNRINKELVINAFMQAYWKRKPDKGLIFHSDRGSQYASNNFRNLLKQFDIKQSMSGKGNCYDNAVAESFFKTIKVELINWETYYSRTQARTSIFEYIEAYYNKERRHSALNYLSPNDFEVNYRLQCA